MPNPDLDPYPPSWSSSSSSVTNLSPPPSLCCWKLSNSSKRKPPSCLTKERLDDLNLTNDFASTTPKCQISNVCFAGPNSEPSPENESRRAAVTLIQSKVDMKEKAIEKERKFIWADKYRPKALEDFICHREEADMLRQKVRFGVELDHHFIFAGPPGVGKRTLIWETLREAFGTDKLETKEKCEKFKLEGGTYSSFPISLRKSAHHIEVNVSDLKEYAPHVVMQLMKNQHDFCHRAIVVYEAEKLSKRAQLSIRSLLESFGSQSKVFLLSCSYISKLKHLSSVCTVVQLHPPSSVEIVEVLKFISNQEAIELPFQLAQRIANKSNHSLRQAIRSFEATWQSNYPFREDQMILTGWEDELAMIAKDMIKEQSPKLLYMIRGKLQLLIKYNICPLFIFVILAGELKKRMNADIQPLTAVLFEHYNREIVAESSNNGDDHLPKMGKNAMFFNMIEEFIAEFMSVYKFLDSKNGGGWHHV